MQPVFRSCGPARASVIVKAMRALTMMVGAISAMGLSGCILFDQLVEEEKCGGHDTDQHQVDLTTPSPVVTGGDFYTSSDGVTRILRWSAFFENVCAEEHAFVTYDIYYDATLPDVDGSGDASPWPLFSYDAIISQSPGHIAGTCDVGLAQWYEPDEAASFSAGIEMHVAASVDPENLRTRIQQVRIVATYAAPP